jgi:L-lactate dehydrogenase complex protein LldG
LSTQIHLFRERFESISGVFHAAANVSAAADIASGIARDESAECIALAHLDVELHQALRGALNSGARVLEPPYPAKDLPRLLDQAQVGITAADWGIAETATLVEVCTNDDVRLVSGLPRTHIGILRASTIVPKFVDAAEPMRKALAEHPENCMVSFISGPSRTGDIEMILTLGVHGPERAHTIVIEDC